MSRTLQLNEKLRCPVKKEDQMRSAMSADLPKLAVDKEFFNAAQ
jgi:hypothetical protein